MACHVSVPLSGVFTVQCLLIIGAFVAVIVVLTEQQRTEFQEALHGRLSLQQSLAMAEAAAPLRERVTLYRTLASGYVAASAAAPPTPSASSGGGSGPVVGATVENATFDSFYRYFTPLFLSDPLLQTVIDVNRSHLPVLTDIGRYHMSFFLMNRVSFVVGSNGSAMQCTVGAGNAFPFPFKNASGCALVGPGPFDTIQLGEKTTIRDYPEGRMAWGVPSTFYNPFAVPQVQFVITLVYQLAKDDGGIQRTLMFSVGLPDLQTVVRSAAASTASAATLYGRFSRVDYNGYYVIASTETVLQANASEVRPRRSSVEGGKSPNQALNTAFSMARAACYEGFNESIRIGSAALSDVGTPGFRSYSVATPNPCRGAPRVLEGQGLVVAALRLTTDEYLDLMLVQHTPREHFYGPSDTARLQGVLIGVAAAILIAGSSIALLAAVWVPLRALQKGMDLAADMRNDEVEPPRPVLLELRHLTRGFTDMNHRLLLARPFLPPSLLALRDASALSQSGDSSDGGGGLFHNPTDNDDDDEGSVFGAIYGGGERAQQGEDPTPRGRSSSSCSDQHTHSTHNHHHKHAATAVASAADRASSRSTPSRRSSSSSAAKSKPQRAVMAIVERFSAMAPRPVAVLAVNVRGFHAGALSAAAMTTTTTVTRLADLHRQLATSVEAAAVRERGVVDAFHGDRFVLAFNTARPVGLPAKAASLCALGLQADIEGSHSLLCAFPLGLAMGLGTGRCLVGNMGTATMQRLSTIGAAYSDAHRLQELCARVILPRQRSNHGPNKNKNAGRTAAKAGASDEEGPQRQGRCLLTGRCVAELDGCVYWQVVGAVDAQALRPSAALVGDTQTATENASYAFASVVSSPTTAGGAPLPPPRRNSYFNSHHSHHHRLSGTDDTGPAAVSVAAEATTTTTTTDSPHHEGGKAADAAAIAYAQHENRPAMAQLFPAAETSGHPHHLPATNAAAQAEAGGMIDPLDQARRRVLLLVLHSAASTGGHDDEWLYTLARSNAAGGPLAAANARMASILLDHHHRQHREKESLVGEGFEANSLNDDHQSGAENDGITTLPNIPAEHCALAFSPSSE